MHRPAPTPGLTLDYMPVARGARLVRVYGGQPCIVLPEALPAPRTETMEGPDVLPDEDAARLARRAGAAGGPDALLEQGSTLPIACAGTGSSLEVLPLTELGGYCFAETPRNLPPQSALCRCMIGQDGVPRLVCAFGRAVQGEAGRGRYSFDFDAEGADKPSRDAPGRPAGFGVAGVCNVGAGRPGGALAGPDKEATAAGRVEAIRPGEELHAICGKFLEELVLPDTLRVIGSCAFYNCRALRRLSVSGGALTAGSDVFLNDFALTELTVRAAPSAATGLFALVNRIAGSVRALFWPQDAAAPLAAVWYPEYWEDYEETPAHILLHTFSGQGYHYRQCFLNGAVLWAEYDAVFAEGHDADDAALMAMLCLDRLRFPYALSTEAEKRYREFLAAHTGLVVEKVLKAQDLDALRALLALEVMDEAAFTQAAGLAAKADLAEAAALLADAEYRLRARRARGSSKKRYTFDF